MRKIFNTIKAGVQAVKEKFVTIHAAAERRIHRISAKIRTAAFRFAIRSNAMLAATRGENFVDSGIKILIAVVIGALLLGVINMGMSIMGIGDSWQYVVKGGVLLVAVIFDVVSNRKGGK